MDGSGNGPAGDGHHDIFLSAERLCGGRGDHADHEDSGRYRTRPVMIVVEMEEGMILELSLAELAEVVRTLFPRCRQELVGQYHVFG